MANPQRLCAAQLTPPGRGAVASIGVRGVGALDAVSRRFFSASGNPLPTFPPGRAVFGRFSSSQAVAEEVVVGIVNADELEIHCHGGIAAAGAILAALKAEGCDILTWREWCITERCGAAPDSAIAAEAAIALAEARTERTAAVLLDQLRGAMRAEIQRIADDLTAKKSAAAEQSLTGLLARFAIGQHLTKPWRVVLAGRPNVGKSSLINALLGYSRSIVFDEPGTTRDVLTATTAFDGWPVELADTAGIRESIDSIEREGAERARQRAESADLAILVSDSSDGWSVADQQLWHTLAGSAPILVVHNKSDLPPALGDKRPPGIAISALTRQGIPELCQAIAAAIVPHPPTTNEAIPFTERQAQLIAKALDYAKHGEHRLAIGALYELLKGRVY